MNKKIQNVIEYTKKKVNWLDYVFYLNLNKAFFAPGKTEAIRVNLEIFLGKVYSHGLDFPLIWLCLLWQSILSLAKLSILFYLSLLSSAYSRASNKNLKNLFSNENFLSRIRKRFSYT